MRRFDETVHWSIAGRKRYKRKMWIVFAILVVILIGCSVMFTFANYSWDPEQGFSPTADPKEPYQVALLVLGAVIAIAACVLTFVYCWFDIGKFYRTQKLYFASKQFRTIRSRVRKQDLTLVKNKTLKWYKKLGYINSQELREVKEKKKMLAKGKEKETAKN